MGQVESTQTSRWRLILATLFVAVVVYGFQQTAITPALPVVQRDLGASREWATWLLSGYFIVASVTPVFLGKLADRTSKRRILLGALIAFVLGSVGAALSPSIGLIVVCRLVQGLGGAVFPLAFAIVRDGLPDARVGSGIGILSGGFGVGALAGYGLGGLITQFIGWRWIFGIGAIVLTATIALVAAVVPASDGGGRRGLDTPGAVLFGVALAAVIVGVTEGPERGWGSSLVVGMFVLSAVAAGCWVYRELHTDEPLMDLRVLASRTILLTNLASMLSGYSAIGVGVLLTFLIQGRGGGHLALFGLVAGPLLTGLVLMPRALGQAVGGPIAGPLSRRFTPSQLLAAAMMLVAGGVAALAVWRSSLWGLIVELAVVGLGFGLAISVMGALVTLSVDMSETGVSSAINSVVRRVGGAVGAQVGVALLAAMTDGADGEPTAAAFTTAFIVAAGAAFAGAVCALMIDPRHLRRHPPPGQGEHPDRAATGSARPSPRTRCATPPPAGPRGP